MPRGDGTGPPRGGGAGMGRGRGFYGGDLITGLHEPPAVETGYCRQLPDRAGRPC